MKAIFISYNQAYHEEIIDIMERSQIRGYTYWETVKGKGSFRGEPHLGDHAWPTLNSALLIFADDSLIPSLKAKLKDLDAKSEAMGLRFFTWTIDS
ncbi:MAG: hypothetical protein LKI53_03150 [Bacteroidales bacterium]|jgi:hypothetical protein|nr:hypothetical protein [Bacteroidales bacterium]